MNTHTHTYEVPQKVKDALTRHQISFTTHTATPLTAQDLAQADLIFCMEQPHTDTLLDRYAQYTDKIWLLSDFACDKPQDVPDPIGLEGRAFAKQAEQLYKLCQAAASRINKEKLWD